MLDLWNNASLALFDFLLGWILYLPTDLALLILALITAGLMALVRPLTTNQDLLRRVAQDRSQLKKLVRRAGAAKDKEALTRYRTTNSRLSMRKLSAEFMPLLVVIVPVAMLATWAMFRMEFHPPMEDEPVEVVAYAPLSAAGEIMHLIPRSGLEATQGWIQAITIRVNQPSWWDHCRAWVTNSEPKSPEPDAVATWVLKGKARNRPYSLLFRFRDQTIARELRIGQPIYSPALVIQEKDPLTTQIKMREVRFLGVVPGLGDFFPGWLVGYLIIVLPLVFVTKGVLGIY